MKEEGLRFNKNKTKYDLLPPYAIEQLAKVLTAGANKYAERNWEKGMKWTTVFASLKRHTAAIEKGEDHDPETLLLHAAHIMCNAAFLTEYYKIYPQGDDRPHKYLNDKRIGLDIDEVLCDFTQGWSDLYDTDPRPTSWYYDREMPERFKQMKENKTLDKFYAGLKPKIKGDQLPFEPVCYVTSRPVSTELTERWLDYHNFPKVPVVTVAIGESKLEAIKKFNLDLFIDDGYHNFVELNKNGILCYLWDAPHNQRYQVGHKRLYNFKDVL